MKKDNIFFFFFQSVYFGPLWDERLRGLLIYNLSRPTHVDGFHCASKMLHFHSQSRATSLTKKGIYFN